MLFNSLEFAIFFPVVVLLFFSLPHKYRWALLLFASCFFYMFFKPIYILILAFTIVIDYFAGILIEGAHEKGKRKKFLLLSLFANIGVLAVFKYYNFLTGNINETISLFGSSVHIPYLKILLPIGLSFHTFQAMSYTIEVYRGTYKAERHFGIYALYVMFFPQLVAGPIERPQNIIHQFHEKKFFDYDRITSGLRLMLWGFFKKVVIADTCAIFVNQVYNSPGQYLGFQIVVATILFAYQIYCDFSGYSDIALGAARVMGYNLMLNFRRPYFAQTIRDFWSRWHISLSTWFRDYLYIPLGGNRVKVPRWYFNLFVTFLISGVWHGANWTYILWGALHGAYLVMALITEKIRTRLRHWTGLARVHLLDTLVQTVITFALVCFGWLFFRANNIKDAFGFLRDGCVLHKNQLGIYMFSWAYSFDFRHVIVFIIFLEVVEYFYEKGFMFSTRIANLPFPLRWLVYLVSVMVILIFGKFNKTEFIYYVF